MAAVANVLRPNAMDDDEPSGDPRDELSRGSDVGPFGIKLRRGTDGGRLVISQTVDPLDAVLVAQVTAG
jgi:hypothetical protein